MIRDIFLNIKKFM